MLSLHEKTLLLLDARRKNEPLTKIAESAGLNYWWLVQFARHRNNDPGVNGVEKLYRFLSGKQLDL